MKRFTKLFSLVLVLVLTVALSSMSALAASPIMNSEEADQSYQEVLNQVNIENGHDGFHLHTGVNQHYQVKDVHTIDKAAKACDHVGTLKGTTNVGKCSNCGSFLYYVYCKPCGKYTGVTICLCR